SFGTNWRMMEVQAAIGRIQLRRMSEWTKKRQLNAMRIAEVCKRYSSIRIPPTPDYIHHAQYKFYVFVRPEKLKTGWTRDRIVEAINAQNVPCYQGSCSEVYLERAFDDTAWRPSHRLKAAKELGETSIMFLVHPTLSSDEITKTCAVVEQVLSLATCLSPDGED